MSPQLTSGTEALPGRVAEEQEVLGFLVFLASGGCECPSPGRVQSQVGEGLEQPDLVGGIPAHGKGTQVPVIFKVKTKPFNT